MLHAATSILWIIVFIGILMIGGFAIYVWAKGAVAGETPDQRQTRLNSVFDLLKFLLGTIVVGILTTALSESIKEREQILKEKEQVTRETEEIGKLLSYALAADGQARVHFADFFAHLTRDQAYRQQWERYKKDIENEVGYEAAIKSTLAGLRAEIEAGNSSSEDLAKLVEEYRKQAGKLTVVQNALAPLIPPAPTATPSASIDNVIPIKLAELDSANQDTSASVPDLFAKRFNSDENQMYDFLKQHLASNNFSLHTSTNFVDLVGVRKPMINDLYDDEIFALWVDERGKKHAEGFRATCDPGVAPEISRWGHAQLRDGRYEFRLAAREKGPGKGDLVLAQSGPVLVSRRHTDGRYEGDEQGDFGILIKPGGTDEHVGINGYGSQAIFGGKDGSAWKRLFEIITKVAPPSQKTFRYTLLSIVED